MTAQNTICFSGMQKMKKQTGGIRSSASYFPQKYIFENCGVLKTNLAAY